MGFISKLNNLYRPAQLTAWRITLALIVAVGADALQFALGPLGWVGVDQLIDAAAMALTTLLLGFHVLLLPTFALEFIPLVDMIPTWIGCVIAVIALRKRDEPINVTVTTSPVNATPPLIAPPPIASSEFRVPPTVSSSESRRNSGTQEWKHIS